MVKWTPKSEDDLSLIQEHIFKNFNPDLAIKVVLNITNYTNNILSKNPLAGTLVESNPFFSKLVYEGNSIYYCHNPRDNHLYVVYIRARGQAFDESRLSNDEVA